MEIHQNPDSGRANGNIFNIQHFCLHDGPGIRTAIFFKGCPLYCLWCHNPEGISPEQLLSFDERKCIYCGACVAVCPAVHQITEGTHTIDRTACTHKGACAGVCVTKALEMVGREIEAGEAVAEALRDKPYYDGSGGGVTLSGGEPAMQPEFLYALAALFRKENIHTALETSGFCDYKILETVLPYIDLFLFDYKETDPGRHQEYTGVLNTPILENLSRLCRAGARVILRCPIIPGLNDRDDHFRGIAELAAKYPAIEGVELLPYHKLAAAKTGRLGLNAQTIYPQVSGEITAVWSEAVSAYGARVI